MEHWEQWEKILFGVWMLVTTILGTAACIFTGMLIGGFINILSSFNH